MTNEIVTEALLPCPFCEGPTHFRAEGDVVGCYHIGMPHCPVGRWTMTVEQWNHRTAMRSIAQEPALSTQNDAETGEGQHPHAAKAT